MDVELRVGGVVDSESNYKYIANETVLVELAAKYKACLSA